MFTGPNTGFNLIAWLATLSMSVNTESGIQNIPKITIIDSMPVILDIPQGQPGEPGPKPEGRGNLIQLLRY